MHHAWKPGLAPPPAGSDRDAGLSSEQTLRCRLVLKALDSYGEPSLALAAAIRWERLLHSDGAWVH